MAPPILGYWDIRGLAESIRCLLHYTGTEFEDKRYTKTEDWQDVDKKTMDLDFPNLPYYIDGDVKMTQSFAIIWYISRKHGLMPKVAEKDLWRVQMVELQVVDFLMAFARLCYGVTFEEEKDGYIKSLPEKLAPLSKFMGENPWILGDQLTHVDFILHEALDRHRYLAKDYLDGFPNLKAFFQRFEALPNVDKYHNSDKFKRWPVNMFFAKFGGSGNPPEL